MLIKKYALIAGLILLSSVATHAQQQKWQLVWSDEFNYEGLPDSSKWGYEVGFVRNKEPQFYTYKRLENAHVQNGHLIIEAKKEHYKDANYTSASLNTQGIAEFQYGRMEMRAKVPKGLGSWPAFWMLGDNHGKVSWPYCGEIDIVEYVGKDSTQVYGTVHFANDARKYQTEGRRPKVGDPSDGFHVYAVEWNKDSLSFFYDKNRFFVFHVNKQGTYAQSIFNKKFYLLVNLALGRAGTLGGLLDDKILPLKYEIDYVRVYQQKDK
ncbi:MULTISPECIES: glycoside hydrolase family 16 protein [Chitinophagaceae]